jgi:Family of unknown function (DUF6152)
MVGGVAMKFRLAVVFICAIGILGLSHSVFAHHSSAAYDLDHPLTLEGTVTNFEWSNPHVFIHFDVKDDKGNVENWRVEGNSPNMLTRVGWSKDMIKPGDQLEVTGAPAKNGSKIMRLSSVKLTNGQKFDGQGFK